MHGMREPRIILHYPFITGTPRNDQALAARAFALTPTYLPNHVRADLSQEIVLAVLEGLVSENDLTNKSVAEIVKRARKVADWNFNCRSLSQQIGNSDKTLGDMLADPTAHLFADSIEFGRATP